jgi:hypothetical protein
LSERAVIFNLELNVEKVADNSRRIEFILFRALGLWTRICRLLGVPDDSPIITIVQKVQSLTMLIRTLHTSAILLQAASGPIGWAMAGLSVGATVMAMADTMTSLGE